jgi:hypothetical protein
MRIYLSICFLSCAAGLALGITGCGGPSQTLTISGISLGVQDQQYTTKPAGSFCSGFSANQAKFRLVDYQPACPLDVATGDPDPRDPAKEHSELQIIVSLGANPAPLRMPFMFDAAADCDNGGANAIAFFYHFPAGTLVPDKTLQASSGSIQLSQYDTTNQQRAKGTFTLTFGEGAPVMGKLDAGNCD